MKRYEKYKPSAIEWIGEIPEHWDVGRLKNNFFIANGNGFPEELQGKSQGKYPFYKVSDINMNSTFVDVSNNYVNEEDVVKNRWNVVKANSILAAKIGEALRKNHRKICRNDCFIDNNMLALTPKNHNIKYSYYFFSIVNFDWFTNPGAVPSVSMDMLRSSPTLLIPMKEQTSIANYLDRKTTQIDHLVTQKQRLIDLLNEEKTAIINQAVSKGINPNAPMKDSGIPWLGEIPTHWEIRKLKYVSKINPEALTENTKEDFRFFYIDISSVDSEGNITDLIELLFKDAPSRARRIVKREDTIISTVRTYLKAIAFIQREDSNLICSTGFSVIRPNPKVFRPKFLFHLLRSDKIINSISSLSKGVSYPAIDSEDLEEMATWFPPREEQDAILNYIEANKYRIDKTISKINKEIELLQEYRTALISEAVTGKIDVRI